MKRINLKTEKREVLGRKVKKLRKEGLLPVNVFGKKIKSISLQVKIDDFKKVWDQVGETGLIDIDVDGKVHPVLIHNVQIDPASGEFLHSDFHEVSLTEKTTAKVPVELQGESPAVSQKLGDLIQPVSELEVEALPEDLPEKLTLDISGLVEVDNTLTVGDIKIDPLKVKILAEPTEIVVKITALVKEEIIVPTPAAEAPEGTSPEGEVVEGVASEGAEAAPETPPSDEQPVA